MKENNTVASEWDIVARCKEGDHDAFREVYDLYKDRVFSTAVRMLGNFDDAEDTLQDIFIKIFNNINKFKWKSSFSTWVYKITVNTCIDHIRRREKNRNTVDLDTHSHEIPEAHPEKTVSDFRIAVEQEIKNLPEGYKTVFILHAIEGFKHNEIAKILDISTGTSKSQFFQAKAQLRKRLLPYLEVLKYEMQ